MALTVGTRVGSYEVTSSLGAGGMGEVYRAHDTKLNRDVALKILPEPFASDPDRLARFVREAQTLAAMNHPHIAHIHGLEESSGVRALVMELVEGEDLTQRIARGTIAVSEAIAIARQIADALDAAHERGIVHRDLKPANIKLTAEGVVKVLDFGLAKAVGASGMGTDQPDGPASLPSVHTAAMTSPAMMTRAGVILGTAAYMAPEQATGKPVDKRADIWAFGCVLFEMLTGRPLFRGESVTETLAAVVRDAPPLDALPPDTPSHIRELLRRCLERDPRRRVRDIGDVRYELEAVEGAPAAAAHRPRTAAARALALSSIGVVVAALAAAAGWWLKPTAPAQTRTFDVVLDAVSPPAALELSPGGSRVAYVARDHLFIRDLAQLTARDLGEVPRETNGLVWSDDESALAIASRDGKIRRFSTSGGPPLVVCDIPETHQVLGIVWRGDEISFAAWRGNLYRVDARGGVPRLWLAIDPKTEIDFHALAGLPDGRAIFATHRTSDGAGRSSGVFAIEAFDGVRREQVLPAMAPIGAMAYISTGHLVFARAGTNAGLWALPFDRAPLDPKQAVLIVPDATNFSAARDGTLLVNSGTSASQSYQLVALDRTGQVRRVLGDAPDLAHPVLSRDGARLAVVRGPAEPEVWIYDVNGGAGTRVTFDASRHAYPAWFPAGDRVLFSDHPDFIAAGTVAAVEVNGTGKPQVWTNTYRAVVTPDAKELLYTFDDRGLLHLRRRNLAGDAQAQGQKVFATEPEPDVSDFALSHDGRLLAYAEFRGGQSSVFVTRYPDALGKWQVFENGGQIMRLTTGALRWARDTNELFFVAAADNPQRARVMSAVVTGGDAVTVRPAVQLFEANSNDLREGLDVSPEGKTLFMRRATGAAATTRRLILIENWFAQFAKDHGR